MQLGVEISFSCDIFGVACIFDWGQNGTCTSFCYNINIILPLKAQKNNL
jgi:hypothetical protein